MLHTPKNTYRLSLQEIYAELKNTGNAEMYRLAQWFSNFSARWHPIKTPWPSPTVTATHALQYCLSRNKQNSFHNVITMDDSMKNYSNRMYCTFKLLQLSFDQPS